MQPDSEHWLKLADGPRRPSIHKRTTFPTKILSDRFRSKTSTETPASGMSIIATYRRGRSAKSAWVGRVICGIQLVLTREFRVG